MVRFNHQKQIPCQGEPTIFEVFQMEGDIVGQGFAANPNENFMQWHYLGLTWLGTYNPYRPSSSFVPTVETGGASISGQAVITVVDQPQVRELVERFLTDDNNRDQLVRDIIYGLITINMQWVGEGPQTGHAYIIPGPGC